MELVILIHVGIAIWLYNYFAKKDRGFKEPVKALKTVAFIGGFSTIFAGLANELALPDSLDLHLSGVSILTLPELALSALFIGFAEETIKFLLVAFFVYQKRYFDELTDGVVYFALAGIWFGAIESIGYALSFGPDVGIMRALITPFLHAGFCALAGVGLARHKVLGKSWLAVYGWFGLAVFAHALYDFLLFTGSGWLYLVALGLALVINLGLFYLYRRAQKIDESLGKSAVGENRFCRACGVLNPQRTLFCIKCGKRT